jgi:RNA polymerase-binding transcription factor
MNKRLVEELAHQLKRRRSSIIFGGSNREIAPEIVDERESELEESAQLDRITNVDNHLEERGQKTLRDIEVALDRLAIGQYGSCQICGEEIGSARLKALPTATLCIDCAKDREKNHRTRATGDSNLLYSRIDFEEV